MKIYDQELLDGINLVGITRAECDIVESHDYKGDVTETLAKTIARYAPSNPNQSDLYYLTCILASVGWNKNDDVFGKDEFWSAKNSPEDKPFNYMHDETDIIGHMTGSVVLDRAGNEISKDLSFEELPDELDIAVSAVIYKSWSDIEQIARIREILEEISQKTWAVSMECLFRSFDYAVVTPTGEHKVVARTNESAFLTKHLRAYGGSGEWEGHKIGRLLRNISFSGIGLVKKPANPRSIILNNDNSLGENLMADAKTVASENDEKVTKLEADLAIANQKLVDLESAKADEVKVKDEEISTLKSEMESVKAELKTSQSNLETAKAEKDEVMKQLKEMQEKVRSMERRSVLTAMKLDSEVIEDMLEKFKAMDDNAFTVAVTLAKTLRPSYGEETSETETETETETEVDVAEAEEVEDKTLNDVGDDESEAEKVRAGLREWFSKSVLKTTKNLK